jgi:GcrA cell cycle regulator
VNVWQPPVLARLEDLLQQPLSYAEIAAGLSKEFGVEFSKNATIAKATRCGLADQHRPSPARHKRKPVYRHPVAKKTSRPPGKVGLQQLDSTTCRFPVEGQWPPYFYCGTTPLEGLPYCAVHADVCYIKGR